jgi:hypothetical protein
MMRKIVGFLLAMWLALMVFPAMAQHECQGGHNCNDGGAGIVGGDVSIANELVSGNGDFNSLSLGQSLGDVDIAGCIVTTQWGIIVYQRQGFVYDVFCLARELDHAGKHDDAAEMRCLHKESAKLYGARCREVMNWKPPEGSDPPVVVAAAPAPVVRAQEEEERTDRLDAIEKRLDQDAANRRAYARQAQIDKRAEESRAYDAFNAYKAAQQMEMPQQQEEPPNE